MRKSLICKGSRENGLVLVPQSEGHNNVDYTYIMSTLGLTSGRKEKNFGNRKIAKCYKYFSDRIDNDICVLSENEAIQKICDIYAIIKKALLLKLKFLIIRKPICCLSRSTIGAQV